MHDSGDKAGPTGLMTGAEARAIVAVQIFVEQDEIAPVRVILEFPCPAIHRPPAIRVLEEDAGKSAPDLLGHLVEIHSPPGTGWTLDGELIAVVHIIL